METVENPRSGDKPEADPSHSSDLQAFAGHEELGSGRIEELLSFYRLPFGHHKHLKWTILERLNEEIKRWTLVVRIFPNEDSWLRLIRVLAVETHENWIEANRYLDMSLLKEMKKALMELVA